MMPAPMHANNRSRFPRLIRHRKRIILFTVTVALLWVAARFIAFRLPPISSILSPAKLLHALLPKQAAAKTAKSYAYSVSFAGKPPYLHANDSPTDVCAVLPGCFPDSHYASETEAATRKKCQGEMGSLMRYYHSGFAVDPEEDNLLVGFLSILPIRHPNLLVLQTYNVCIRPDRRKQGIATRLMNESIARVVAHEKQTVYAQRHGEGKKDWLADPPVLLALDVNWEDKFAAEAFALYVKMGFTRYMWPCESVYRFDYRQVVQAYFHAQESDLADIESTTLKEFPFGAYYLGGARWAERRMERADGGLLAHFCMYRMLDDKDPLAVGKEMQARYYELKTTRQPVATDEDV